MTGDNRKRHKPASLSVQVTGAEQRVLGHRRMVGVRLATLGDIIYRRMSSPAALLWAGGVGFAAGEFTRRKPSVPAKAEQTRRAPGKLFDRALKLIAFVQALSSSPPVTDRYPDQRDLFD